MAYTDTFIEVAPDCPVVEGVVPVMRGKRTPIHLIQYRLLTDAPYTYSHKELVFAVHVARQGVLPEELVERRDEIWADLFKKGHPCLRASALTKRYGWGAHYDGEGKIALYGMDSVAYGNFTRPGTGVKLLKAMRSKRR